MSKSDVRPTSYDSVLGRRVLVTVYNNGRGAKTMRRHHHLEAAYDDQITARLSSVRSFIESCQQLVADRVATSDGPVHTFRDLTKLAAEATLASHQSGENVTFVSKVPKAFGLEVSQYRLYRPDLPVPQRQYKLNTASNTQTTLPGPVASARFPQGSAKSRTYSGPVPYREVDADGFPQKADGYRSDVDGYRSS